jgi:hypothetical protein
LTDVIELYIENQSEWQSDEDRYGPPFAHENADDNGGPEDPMVDDGTDYSVWDIEPPGQTE